MFVEKRQMDRLMTDICIFYAHDNTALMAYNPCIKIQVLYVHLEFLFIALDFVLVSKKLRRKYVM